MYTFSKEKFAKRLKKQRLYAGFERQTDLAQTAGISAQAISAYEAGDRIPSADSLAMIADALGCTTDYLVQLEDVATREKTSVANQIGLSERAISVLESVYEMNKKTNNANGLGERPLDVINFILESDDFKALQYTYGRLLYVMEINSFVGLDFESKASTEVTDKLDYEAALHNLTIINTKDAVDFYIRKLGSLISQAIFAGIQSRVDDGTYLEKIMNAIEALKDGEH